MASDATASPVSPPPTSRAALRAQLAALGVRAGDVLMLHASLRRIGPVEGGVVGLLDALQEAVTPRGTLVMLLCAELDWYAVDAPPEETAAALAARVKPFDARTAPAMRDVGYLAEAFRRRTGVGVTSHPDGRFAAWGAGAEALLRDDPWHDYYGPGSVLERLVRAGGKVLRMGADTNTVTLLHHAEYLCALPQKRRRTIYFLLDEGAGPVIRGASSLDNEHGIVDHPGDYFAELLEAYLAEGHGVRGQVGGAASELLDAAHLVDFGVRWMEANLR